MKPHKPNIRFHFQVSISQLLFPAAMDAIITEFLNSDLCESLGNDPRCPDVIDAVLRNGLPLLAADEYANGDFEKVSINKKKSSSTHYLHNSYQACNAAKPGTCPARRMTIF